ncbi:phosphatidylserine decarboxylase [Dyadobacter sp. BE34]|uniref:Phosphatidylserine decarboxylase proenzyme n=1 Tax=Dyadobacter fermentans TaxID=94254 RepID=A0ABU1R3D0_9BACT|nr:MULTISPECIES: phosphatidylserine decarboxylase family protein [Dyadobacter]MDR6807737.1 phosphatidylserine decarboxylase [Dyadobacter fermentans]MDR7045478.1 phosphatidylserine decarboxylase [Dyadobacter sp. BE242]MDR7199791.1 phosphatidylserine decarboxylase [Dyadobacter sp. BE34]MDR7217750.1 phosphatidylserine decarboxylase [Dyadobacter sp. BE31]MDR7265682.1 phosphatidylserine decarboxylase [Dyadobacter sp. BE32]
MKLHREGYTIMAVTAIVLIMINLGINYLLPDGYWIPRIVLTASIVIFFLVVQFFRVPTRVVRQSDREIVAPCDGKVVVIEEVVETEYFKGPRRQISIFMSPLNVHVNWNPISGVIQYFKYHPGLYLVAWHPKSSTENERTTVVIRNKEGIEVLFRQIAGAAARRIRWYVKEGDKVEQSTEMGFIKFGSRVDLYIPLDAEINVNLQDKTVGSVTVLATLK